MKLTDKEIAKTLGMSDDNLRKTYKSKKPEVYNILRLGVICSKLGLNEALLVALSDMKVEIEKDNTIISKKE